MGVVFLEKPEIVNVWASSLRYGVYFNVILPHLGTVLVFPHDVMMLGSVATDAMAADVLRKPLLEIGLMILSVNVIESVFI